MRVITRIKYDDEPEYEEKLQWVCNNIHLGKEILYTELTHFPSIQIGIETAFMSLQRDTLFLFFLLNLVKEILLSTLTDLYGWVIKVL